jgi:hypothetical protein
VDGGGNCWPWARVNFSVYFVEDNTPGRIHRISHEVVVSFLDRKITGVDSLVFLIVSDYPASFRFVSPRL